ncbi:MAG: exodeoxyribonuclease III [Candidatus Campbellbacteria bacterium]|nr:exodeoxyribonuclease III [Candidatus Campbellbacteria bacterium]
MIRKCPAFPISNGMRIISWNVNGLRSLFNQGYWDWFEQEKPDIFCLQETKVEEGQLSPEVQKPEGYFAYFNSSKERKGYSGVAVYSKKEPKSVSFDVLPEKFNTQGRLIEAAFEDFVLLNVYFPNGGGSPEKLQYKLDFYDAFLEHIKKLRKNGKKVIFCGDVNVAHEEIDIARPKENEGHVGFLPEERAWMDEVLSAGFVDTFRHFHPDTKNAYSYWDTISRARDRNIGWRLDYFIVSQNLLPKIKRSEILSDVYGSDHCPVGLEVSSK